MTQGPYHLIPIGGFLILSYLFSYLAAKKQLIPSGAHRKFWNSLLLIFFLSAAMLGMILAVKVNYKLEMKWLEEAMQWHVDLGIAFALVAFIHLSRHLRYYLSGKDRKKDPLGNEAWTAHLSVSTSLQRAFFLLLGYVSLFAQLVLLREFIKTFHGNELLLGIFLALWMVLSAGGAGIGSASRLKTGFSSLLGSLLILSAAPMLSYLLLILAGRFLFLPGYQPPLLESLVLMTLLTGPLALTSGYLFSYVSRSVNRGLSSDRYYRFDSLGSLLAGLLFGALLVFFLDNIQALGFLFLTTCLVMTFIFRYPSGKYGRTVLIMMAILVYAVLMMPAPRLALEGIRYPGEDLLESRDTPSGNLSLTSRNGLLSAYLDRNPVLISDDVAQAEERIHYAALQHPEPKSFLILGGGVSASLNEAWKYRPDRLDYCEADPWIYRLQSRYFLDSLPGKLRFIPMDGRNWLMRSDSLKYDVIISAAGDPLTLGWNRFFTLEFFHLVKARLSDRGTFALNLSTGGNYVNSLGSKQLGITLNTLETVFDHVIMVPGQSTWFLASSGELSLDFPALLEKQAIETRYVHPDYLEAGRLRFDAERLKEGIPETEGQLNLDLHPRLFFSRLRDLESLQGRNSFIISGILGFLLFLVLLIYQKNPGTAMYIGGFTGASMQVLLILVVQSLYGFAYLVAPFMITLFMAGIVAGSLLRRRFIPKPASILNPIMLWSMALVLVFFFLLLKSDLPAIHPGLSKLILGVLNFLPGLAVGIVYGISLKLLNEAPGGGGMGKLFSSDLAGAALGSFVPILFLLPLTGMLNTLIFLVALNMAAGLYLWIRGLF